MVAAMPNEWTVVGFVKKLQTLDWGGQATIVVSAIGDEALQSIVGTEVEFFVPSFTVGSQ